ncbi:hypothetical protein GCM10017562_59230 [Streptomyces roseofulvus]
MDLGNDATVLAVHAAHPLAAREAVRLEDLADETLLVMDCMPETSRARHMPDHTPSGRPVHLRTTTRYWQELLALVASGEGVTVAAPRAPATTRAPARVPPDRERGTLRVAMIWRSHDLSAEARSFVRAALNLHPSPPGHVRRGPVLVIGLPPAATAPRHEAPSGVPETRWVSLSGLRTK